MSLTELVIRLLIVIPFLDVPVAWYLVRAAKEPPRIQLLYDRARTAVIGTLAAEMGALVSLFYVNGIAVPPPWGVVLLLGALALPGFIPLLFLADLLFGRYDKEA